MNTVPLAFLLHQNHGDATDVINRLTIGRVNIDSLVASEDRRIAVDICILVKSLNIDLELTK